MTMPKKVNLVSHTHWDRAWYVTFQEYRIRLVQLIDRLLDILAEQSEFTYMLDGQMNVLDDYLEVRPQRKAELQALTRSGRVQVGPWYVLADEYLVSPESLIRNLKLGHHVGEEFGGVMKIGYVPDGFGHIAQLPQILNGFGIDNAFFWRGMGTEGDEMGTEFEWLAPDGSSVTTILMPWGYHTASNLGYGVHWGDFSQMQFDMELAQGKLAQFIDKLMPMSNIDTLLLMNGIDHQEAQAEIPEILDQANEHFGDTFIQQTNLQQHLDDVRQYITENNINLPCYEGEFRWGRYSEILQGVHCTRLHLKQRNHQVETLLERITEPIIVMAHLAGASILEQQDGTDDLLQTAWKWLLLNHPHDDMYGCGIDEVHYEMEYRFSQAEQIGKFLARDNMRALARHIDFTEQGGIPILCVNPLNWLREEIVEIEIDFDFDDSTADDFEIVTADGTNLPIQVVKDEMLFWMETLKANRKRRVTVLVSVSLPALGYTTLFVYPRRLPRPQFEPDTWRVEPNVAENRYLRLQIAEDGTLDITHKETNVTYKNLNYFEDVADIGDAYSFCPLQADIPISTRKTKAKVKLHRIGSNAVTYEIMHHMNLPQQINEDRTLREGETSIELTSLVTMERDCPYIHVKTSFYNSSKDHKLSVVFPTQIDVEVAHVDESFAVVERKIDLPDAEGWVEDPTPLMHQRTFTDLSNGTQGLAILNRGLTAVEVTRDVNGTRIAIPLVRAVGWLSRDDLWTRRIAAGPLVPTPGAQCLQEGTYEYAILPHSGDWRAVYQQAYNYTTPITASRADTHAGIDLRDMNITRDDPTKITHIPFPREGNLPATHSFLKLEGDGLVLSAFYRSKEYTILRFFNITSKMVEAILTSKHPLLSAHRLNLNEEPQEQLVVDEAGQVKLNIKPNQIITMGLKFA